MGSLGNLYPQWTTDGTTIQPFDPTLIFKVLNEIISDVFGEDGLVEVRDSAADVKAFLNSNGASYINGGFLGIGLTNPSTNLVVNGGQGIKRVNTSGGYNPSALTENYLISFLDTTSPRNAIISTEDIQSGSPGNPRVFIIKDESGGAGTNNITVQGESGNIDGVASVPINTNNGSMVLYADGADLWTIAIK